MKRPSIALMLVVALAAVAARGDDSGASSGESKRPSGAPARQALSAAEVQRLVAELGSANYRGRETAMQQLVAAGSQVIEPVAKAAQTDDLEVVYRCVSVLQALLESNDKGVQEQADRALEALAAKKTTAVANLASDALALYQSSRQDRATDQLRRLGADISLGVPDSENRSLLVRINKEWRGHTADFELLKQIPGLQKLTIINVPLDDAALKTMGQLSQVGELDLFGTGVSTDTWQSLKAALPSAKVDCRNGALLGIVGAPGLNNCIVQGVQSGSAAETADVRQGDEIVSFEGQPVQTFEEFTERVAAKKGGERVKLEVRRGEQTLSKQVTLGQWQ